MSTVLVSDLRRGDVFRKPWHDGTYFVQVVEPATPTADHFGRAMAQLVVRIVAGPARIGAVGPVVYGPRATVVRASHPDGYRLVEGVRYWPFVATFRTTDGRRRRIKRWSPGYPWVRDEIGRELHDRGDVVPGSCTLRQVAP